MLITRVRRVHLMRMFAVLGVVTLMVAGCSEDTKDKAGEVGESLQEDAENNSGKLAAYALAETFRSTLKANAAGKEEGLRSMAVLEEVQSDMPGDPEISEIKDDDKDGFDDDGNVLVTARDQVACVVIPETGTDTQVKEGAC
jgi:protein involved in sex pheromone biosynthesis